MYDLEGMLTTGAACPDEAPGAAELYQTARKSHAACMVCGDGALAFGLRFVADPTGGVEATFRARERFQGYAGILHGGVISTLLDAAMVHCLFARGVTAVTAEMTVRFLREVPVDCDIRVGATLVGERHGVFQLAASLSRAGMRLAVAKGKFCRTAR